MPTYENQATVAEYGADVPLHLHHMLYFELHMMACVVTHASMWVLHINDLGHWTLRPKGVTKAHHPFFVTANKLLFRTFDVVFPFACPVLT